MDSTAQHIALLTALGWTPANIAAAQAVMDIDRRAHGVRRDSFSAWGLSDEMEKAEDNPEYRGRLPELTLDLMASAEATLKRRQCDEYTAQLNRQVRALPDDEGVLWKDSIKLVRASKEQRREAYLRVRGLWVD